MGSNPCEVGMKRLILIPARDEEKTVGEVLERILSNSEGADILVIDDGSIDRTPKIIGEFKGIKILRHDSPLGYGRSLIDGFKWGLEGDYDVILTIDADLQHPPELIPDFFDAIKEAEIVSGSRYHPDSLRYSEPPKERRRINSFITRVIRILLGLPITDAFCGFKAYRADALRKLKLTESGYGMPLQLWVQVAFLGIRVVELPVPLIYCDPERCFGEWLDNPERRLEYYKRILREELSKWRSMSLPQAHIRTMLK
jgi:dolichol-phosphate mannosyltransferase